MKKQLKDKTHTEAIIYIKKLKEHFKEGGFHEFKDKLWLIKIIKNLFSVSTAFPCTQKGERDLIKFIKRELNLK
jgi:hypothetical protein